MASKQGGDDALEREIDLILEMRRRVTASRDYQHASPLMRQLIEQEIPRLIVLLRERR